MKSIFRFPNEVYLIQSDVSLNGRYFMKESHSLSKHTIITITYTKKAHILTPCGFNVYIVEDVAMCRSVDSC